MSYHSLKTEHVLIALCGMSPAVISETVWALHHSNPPILPRRVVAFTTTEGKTALCSELFASGVWDALRIDTGADSSGNLLFGDTADSVRLIPRFDQKGDLDDIHTTADSTAAADFCLEQIRQFTERPDLRIIFSIAGGRKTMTAIAALCMTLLGRNCDRLCHVLVQPPFDNPNLQPKFYYPTEAQHSLRTQDGFAEFQGRTARISLHDIPFVSVRHLFTEDRLGLPGTFSDMVALARGRIDGAVVSVRIEIEIISRSFHVGGQPISLSDPEFVMLWMLALRGKSSLQDVRGAEELAHLFASHVRMLSHDFADYFINSMGSLKRWVKYPEDARKLFSSMRNKVEHHGGVRVFRHERAVYGLTLPPGHIFIRTPMHPKDAATR